MKIIGCANTLHTCEFIDTWYSTKGAINKHNDLDAAYEDIRNWTVQTTNQQQNQQTPQKLNIAPNQQPVM